MEMYKWSEGDVRDADMDVCSFVQHVCVFPLGGVFFCTCFGGDDALKSVVKGVLECCRVVVVGAYRALGVLI